MNQGAYYTGSKDPINIGDRVIVDDLHGEIQDVFIRHTDISRDYLCYDTGGTLILFDDNTLVLIPFGYPEYIKKES